MISFAYETIRAVAALEGLATSEERFRSLVEASPIGIQGVDLSGRLISVNRAALELHGARDESAILGRSFLDSVAPADRDRVAKMMNRARENSIFDMEFDAILDGGRHTLAAWFTPLIGGDGAVREIIALTQDVTDRKQAEEQLRQAQKMKVVGQLTGGIAHDFNNILAIILGNIELLGEQVSGNAEIEHFVETLERTTRRGAELTQRLLAFSRRQPLDPQDIDITRLVDGMTSMLRRTLGETVGIETDWDPDVWHIHADAGQMENALVNLAINARDAMPDGGMLTFAIANATRDAVPDFVDAGEDGEDGDIDYVRVMVRDTGTGMSADVLQHVFEPFFTTKDVGKGSGLGLSMVYGFVRQSNGRVRIESSEGQGTAVTLFMPRAAPRTQSMSPPEVGGEFMGHGETVLVLEDDPDVRALTVIFLHAFGYRTLEAADAVAARTLLGGGEEIDLILSDVTLPGGLSGPGLVREADCERRGIKVLFMSGHANEDAAPGLKDAGGQQRLLRKPFARRDLAEALRAALDD